MCFPVQLLYSLDRVECLFGKPTSLWVIFLKLWRLALQGSHIEKAGIGYDGKSSKADQRHEPSGHEGNDKPADESAEDVYHNCHLLPYCSLEGLRIWCEIAAELRLVYAVEPSYFLFEQCPKIGLPADCCLAFSGDEPAGDHQPPREEGAYAEVYKFFQDLECRIYDLVVGLVEDVCEVAPE